MAAQPDPSQAPGWQHGRRLWCDGWAVGSCSSLASGGQGAEADGSGCLLQALTPWAWVLTLLA
jgi:hypothetical protein